LRLNLRELHAALTLAELSDRDSLAVHLTTLTGLRLKDACRLRRGQIAFNNATRHYLTKTKGVVSLRIRRSKNIVRKGLSKNHDIPLSWGPTPPPLFFDVAEARTRRNIDVNSIVLDVPINSEQWETEYKRCFSRIYRALKTVGLSSYSFRRGFMRKVKMLRKKEPRASELTLHLNQNTAEAFYYD
jgi:integrase